MRPFLLKFTGDLSDSQGRPVGDLALDLLKDSPHIAIRFIEAQRPRPDDPSCLDKLYSMEVGPDHIAGANGLVVCRPWVKATAFAEGAKNLLAINRAGIGYDKIDLRACTEHDVLVFNAPHGMTHATASAALFFLLGLSKRFPQQDRILRSHRWDLQKDAVGDDLAGQTLGIIGLGRTGLELARLAAPFGLRIVAYSPRADAQDARRLGIELMPDLDSTLRTSDYVSLHCRLESRTRRLLGERELGLMKPTAFLINVARGEIIDEGALVRALREQRLAGAGLDVFEVEPLPSESPLLDLPNVMLTPHWLAATRQAGRATAVSIMRGMLRLAQGELPEHILNPEVLEHTAFRQKLNAYRENASAGAGAGQANCGFP